MLKEALYTSIHQSTGSPSALRKSEVSPHIAEAESFFKIRQWSQDTLKINAQGNIAVSLNEHISLDLYQYANSLVTQGYTLPLLLRFPTLVTREVKRLQYAFSQAIQAASYHNRYTLAYPVKVNPHASIIDAFLEQGEVAFEVGSKAELLLVLAKAEKHHLIICNGFKDETYFKLALEAATRGQNICIVLETFAEATILTRLSANQKIKAKLGVRARLNSAVDGHWQDSNGQYAKFGLTNYELIECVHLLKKHHLLEQLQLLHIHPGSQILSLSSMIKCFQECLRYYHELRLLGVPICDVDIGGGVAIDYAAGEQDLLKDYVVEEYAMAIVTQMAHYCETHHLPQPHILSETGRATVAYSSMIITDVRTLNHKEAETVTPQTSGRHPILRQLWELYRFIPSHAEESQRQELLAPLSQLLKNAKHAFVSGELTLSELAWAEHVFKEAQGMMQEQGHSTHTGGRSQKYLVNLSLFQSLPDHWGIKQFFPMLALHGYQNPLTHTGTFYDLTCDSDGVFKQYLHPHRIQHTLRLPEHPLKYVGFFLTGAYQEILASTHNLFGKPMCVDFIPEEDPMGFDVRSYAFCSIEESLASFGYEEVTLAKKTRQKFGGSDLCDRMLANFKNHSYLDLET